MTVKKLFFFLCFFFFVAHGSLICHSQSSVKFWSEVRDNHIELTKNALTGDVIETPAARSKGRGYEELPYDAEKRYGGKDWPLYGYTMIGKKRLDNLHNILVSVVDRSIDGDFIECGVWRGGASIFARIVLDLYHQCHRTVYVADSFAGLPPSKSTLDPIPFDNQPFLEVPLDKVKHHFKKFNLNPDENVQFIKGFFSESLPLWKSKIAKLAVLRLDGDMYESCADIMANLYEKVSVGGYVIVDDWFGFPCKDAVESFFRHHSQQISVDDVDGTSVYFMKTEPMQVDPTWYENFKKTKIH